VRVRTPDVRRLAALLATQPGIELASTGPDVLDVTGATAPEVAALAASAGIVLHELAPVQASLEDAYLQLTGDSVEYRSTAADATTRPVAGAHR